MKHQRTTWGFPAWRDKLCNWGSTLKQSSAVHIQALVSADGILPGSSSKLQLLVIRRMLSINLALPTGRQVQFRADSWSIPQLYKASNVVRHTILTLYKFQITHLIYILSKLQNTYNCHHSLK